MANQHEPQLARRPGGSLFQSRLQRFSIVSIPANDRHSDTRFGTGIFPDTHLLLEPLLILVLSGSTGDDQHLDISLRRTGMAT